jgi:hypothetical protein
LAPPAGFEPAPTRLEGECPIRWTTKAYLSLASVEGLEPPTCSLEDYHSIQLSYTDVRAVMLHYYLYLALFILLEIFFVVAFHLIFETTGINS